MELTNIGTINYIPSNSNREHFALPVYSDGNGCHFVKWQGTWFRSLRVTDLPTARGGRYEFLTWLGENDLVMLGEDWQIGLERALAASQ